MRKTLLLAVFILTSYALCLAQNESQKPAKLSAEEIVAKHLASIGKTEDLAAVKTRVMTGEGKVSFTPTGVEYAKGVAQFASAENMMIFAMLFDKKDYSYEKAAFDGKEQTIGYSNGRRSLLGDFLKTQDAVLKEGLFGGALSSAWPLLDLKAKNAKVTYAGTVEIDGKQAYKLKYVSRTGDLQISLYFDAENFHHLRTEYKYSIDATMGRSATTSPSSKPTYVSLTEDFEDFKTAGKLTLPMTYKIAAIQVRQNFIDTSPGLPAASLGSARTYLTAKFAGVVYNEPLEPALFKVS